MGGDELPSSETWLDSAADLDDTLLKAIAAAPEIAVAVLAPGAIVQGRYRIDAPIGRGGMGIVWRATDMQLGRAVAIKLEHYSAGEMERLRREARALGSLSHPNVVTVLAVGVHDGVAFIAMELVEGGNARQWLAAEPRSWREIVELYRQAGAGLLAAHGVGIVHRDFKPDNVLVGSDRGGGDRSVRARVADFGIAHAHGIAEPATRADASTTTSDERAGTPAYMAPEQLGGGVVDARADQHAFCVALFEALYGARPDRQLADAARPPMHAATHAPAWVLRALQRGLAHEPTQRWPSMAELLLRLSHPPRLPTIVAACTTGALAVAAVALLAGHGPEPTAACVAAGVAATQWTPARAEQIEAALRATAVPGVDHTVMRLRTGLDAYAEAWAQTWTQTCTGSDDPELDARLACLRERSAELDTTLELLAHADREMAGRAARLGEELADPRACLDPPRGAEPPAPARVAEVEATRIELARARAELNAGHYEDALTRLESVLVEAQRIGYRPLVAETLELRGKLHFERRRHDAALVDFEEAYAIALAERRDDVAVAVATAAAATLDALGRSHEAAIWCANLRALIERAPPDLAKHAPALMVQAHVLAGTAEQQRAAELAQDAVALFADRPGDVRHADALVELAYVEYRRGRFEAALSSQRRALALFEQTLGGDHPRVARATGIVGLYALHADHRVESRAMLERAIDIAERWFGPDDVAIAEVLMTLAHLDSIEDEGSDALSRIERARKISVAAGRPEVPTLVDIDDVLGLTLLGMGRSAEAVEVFRRELDALERNRGPNDGELRFVLNNVALAGRSCGRDEDAELWWRRAIAIDDALGERDYESGTLHVNLGFFLIDRGDLDQAAAELERGRALTDVTMPPDDPDRAWPSFGLARIEARRGRPERAVPLFEDALARWDVGTERASYRELRRELAIALWQEDRDRPRALLLAREGLTDDPGDVELGQLVAHARP